MGWNYPAILHANQKHLKNLPHFAQMKASFKLPSTKKDKRAQSVLLTFRS